MSWLSTLFGRSNARSGTATTEERIGQFNERNESAGLIITVRRGGSTVDGPTLCALIAQQFQDRVQGTPEVKDHGYASILEVSVTCFSRDDAMEINGRIIKFVVSQGWEYV